MKPPIIILTPHLVLEHHFARVGVAPVVLDGVRQGHRLAPGALGPVDVVVPAPVGDPREVLLGGFPPHDLAGHALPLQAVHLQPPHGPLEVLPLGGATSRPCRKDGPTSAIFPYFFIHIYPSATHYGLLYGKRA